MKRWFLAAALAVVLSGCAGISVQRDGVLGWTTTRMTRNAIGRINPFGTTLVINALKREHDDGRIEYGIFVQTMASDWIFHRNLSFRVDRELLQFGSRTSLREDVDCAGGTCTHDERSNFEATAEDLRQIAGGQNVTVRLGGRTVFIEKAFNPTNLQRFREFVAEHVPAGSGNHQAEGPAQ